MRGIGIDVWKEGVMDGAKGLGNDMVFAVGDVGDAPFAESCFDVVMCVL
ncbi:class I SAM-dependent methyltransferase [Bacillus velezensis]|nr:hypothetical protein [Bacillus velezensis]